MRNAIHSLVDWNEYTFLLNLLPSLITFIEPGVKNDIIQGSILTWLYSDDENQGNFWTLYRLCEQFADRKDSQVDHLKKAFENMPLSSLKRLSLYALVQLFDPVGIKGVILSDIKAMTADELVSFITLVTETEWLLLTDDVLWPCYNRLDDLEQYHLIPPTHYQRFALHLIKIDSIEKLMAFLEKNRPEDRDRLLLAYLHHHQIPVVDQDPLALFLHFKGQ